MIAAHSKCLVAYPWRSGQAVEYEAFWMLKHPGRLREDDPQPLVRINIKCDTHSFQSHARISLWSEHKWEYLASIPYPLMDSEWYPTNVPSHDHNFRSDEGELLNQAEMILYHETRGAGQSPDWYEPGEGV